MNIQVLQGPNLNALGLREPEHYGSFTLDDVTRSLDRLAVESGVHLEHLQSNHEGVLVDAIHAAKAKGAAGVLINAAGFTHTSVVLRDAFLATGLPFVEVHISNVHAREPFRHRSLLADVAVGVVTGFGITSYTLGLRGLIAELTARRSAS